MLVLLTVSILSGAGDAATPVPDFLVMRPEPAETMQAIEPLAPADEYGGETPWGAIGLHYGIGVMATAGSLAASYGLATFAAHQGNGLNGAIVGLLIGALLPPILIATTQWATWELAYPDRDRYWPSLIVAFACHLAIFVGGVLGGVSIHDNGGLGLMAIEALVLPAATTSTAYLTRSEPVTLARREPARAPAVAMTIPVFKAVF